VDDKTKHLIETRMAQIRKMQAAALQRALANVDIKVYPLPYSGIASAALQQQQLARMQALQRADPVKFAMLQRQQAAARMRAAAAQQQAQLAGGIIAYPIPYGVLTGAALQRQQAVARMQAGARRQSEVQKELRRRAARMQQERIRRGTKR